MLFIIHVILFTKPGGQRENKRYLLSMWSYLLNLEVREKTNIIYVPLGHF